MTKETFKVYEDQRSTIAQPILKCLPPIWRMKKESLKSVESSEEGQKRGEEEERRMKKKKTEEVVKLGDPLNSTRNAENNWIKGYLQQANWITSMLKSRDWYAITDLHPFLYNWGLNNRMLRAPEPVFSTQLIQFQDWKHREITRFEAANTKTTSSFASLPIQSFRFDWFKL